MNNKHNKYQEPEYIDAAWNHMSQLLDREMPQDEPRRKIWIWWILGGFILVALLISLALLTQGKSLSPERASIETAVPVDLKSLKTSDLTTMSEEQQTEAINSVAAAEDLIDPESATLAGYPEQSFNTKGNIHLKLSPSPRETKEAIPVSTRESTATADHQLHNPSKYLVRVSTGSENKATHDSRSSSKPLHEVSFLEKFSLEVDPNYADVTPLPRLAMSIVEGPGRSLSEYIDVHDISNRGASSSSAYLSANILGGDLSGIQVGIGLERSLSPKWNAHAELSYQRTVPLSASTWDSLLILGGNLSSETSEELTQVVDSRGIRLPMFRYIDQVSLGGAVSLKLSSTWSLLSMAGLQYVTAAPISYRPDDSDFSSNNSLLRYDRAASSSILLDSGLLSRWGYHIGFGVQYSIHSQLRLMLAGRYSAPLGGSEDRYDGHLRQGTLSVGCRYLLKA